MSNRLDQQREKRLQPKRIESTKRELINMGFEVNEVGTTELNFIYKNELVRFFPYSGWHTGKSINDGRGFKKLKSQLI